MNALGNLEDVNALTDLAHEYGLQAVAIVDPILLASGGLKEPAKYGQKGANMIVAEGGICDRSKLWWTWTRDLRDSLQ